MKSSSFSVLSVFSVVDFDFFTAARQPIIFGVRLADCATHRQYLFLVVERPVALLNNTMQRTAPGATADCGHQAEDRVVVLNGCAGSWLLSILRRFEPPSRARPSTSPSSWCHLPRWLARWEHSPEHTPHIPLS